MAVWTRTAALRQVQAWQRAGLKVVFTNGCFDLLHRGHVEYLQAARACGQRLIVGLNNDASVRQLKGAPQPYQSEADRARILDALETVDGVVLFGELTPEQLIRELTPDVLVKGGDYSSEVIVGAAYIRQSGGEVVTVPFIKGYSTSALATRIRHAGGPRRLKKP